MRRYTNILVPIDGTSSSEHALRQACAISRIDECRVLAVVPFISLQEKKLAYDHIAAAVNAIAAEEGISVEVIAQQGRPSTSIIDAAEKRGNDLIVLGKADMNALEQMVIKSFTGRVIGHANSDILVIPEKTPVKLDNIMFCTDGSKYSQPAAETALSFAGSNGRHLTALGVIDVNEEFSSEAPARVEEMIRKTREMLSYFKAKADESGIKVETLIKEGEAHVKILELAREKNADIIILGSHARTGVSRMFMGSVAEKVVSRASCPVLIVKAA